MTCRTINPATGERARTFADTSDAEFVNRKLVNAAAAGSPPWGPVR